ncbi:MAG: hypothetical protein ACLQU1_30040 [Bryobacteraceae bacterium]
MRRRAGANRGAAGDGAPGALSGPLPPSEDRSSMAGHVPDVPVVRLNVFGISRRRGGNRSLTVAALTRVPA